MSKSLKRNLIKYGVSLAICVLMMWWIFSMNGYNANLDLLEKYRILSDAFMVPGALFLMVGLLVWVSNQGGLDALNWAVTNMVFSLIPGLNYRKERYGDYKERKSANRTKGYGFLLIIGGVFLAIAFIFMLLFMKLDGMN